jgi:hypothetical protein
MTSSMIKRPFLKLAAIVLSALAAFCVASGFHVWWRAYRHRKNAEIVLAGLRKLKGGVYG